MANRAVVLLFFAAAASGVEQPDPMTQELMTTGDECNATTGEDGACTVNALQLRVQKVTAAKESADRPSSIYYMDLPPSAPDLRPFPTGLSAEEMGMDELEQMVAAQQLREEEMQQLIRARRASEGEVTGKAEAMDTEEPSNYTELTSQCKDRPYAGSWQGSELCFCQLVENPACRNTGCSCPQGCQGVTWGDEETVTFKNKARVEHCKGPTTVLLTASRSYWRGTSELKQICKEGTVSLLAVMLRNSWRWYQSKVGEGPVNQCFHHPRIASVKFLHLQTFAAQCEFHGMHRGEKNDIGVCVTMSKLGEEESLASEIAQWA